MSDDLKGQVQAEEQTATPMPSEEKPVEETQEPTLPDGVKERTAEEFEKLKEANKSLKEQLEKVQSSSFTFVTPTLDESQSNSGFDTEVPNPTAGATSSNDQNFIDEGGYVDTALLNQKLSKAEKDALEAKLAIERMQKERKQEQLNAIKEKTWTDFPELALGTDNFNPDFDYKVKLELTRQLVEEGKQDYYKAAQQVKQSFFSNATPKAQEAEVDKTISQREQASAQTGTSKGSSEPTDQDDLVEGTMKGDNEAIYKRLQASGN